MTFGRLTVLRFAGRTGPKKRASWFCRCSCGAEKVVTATRLQSGTQSCGCLHREVTGRAHRTHGGSRTPEYGIYHKLIARCESETNRSFPDYGGRGIRVCERWRRSFKAFLADMGKRPSPEHEIDRIDVNGDYRPGNCRWVTRTVNARNKRALRWVTMNGRTMCVSEWAEATGLPRYTIEKRLDSGWTPGAALTTPKRAWTRRTA